jgi:hypothetical protein
MGVPIILACNALYVFMLILLVRFVNAVEQIATALTNHERQTQRLATAVEQLSHSRGGPRPEDRP